MRKEIAVQIGAAVKTEGKQALYWREERRINDFLNQISNKLKLMGINYISYAAEQLHIEKA